MSSPSSFWGSLKPTVAVWFLVGLHGVSAQPQNNIPILREQLAVSPADTSRSRLCYELGKAYDDVNLDSCFYFLNQSLAIAKRAQDPRATARAMEQLGFTCLYRSKDEAKAMQWLKKAIAVATPANDNECLAGCFCMLAIIAAHQHIGNPDTLLARALMHAKRANNWRVLSETYSCTGDIAMAQNDYKRALIAYREYMINARGHDLDDWFTAGLDYAGLLDKSGQHSQARAIYQTLATIKHKLPRQHGYYVYANDVARLEMALKNYAQAEDILLKAVAVEAAVSKPDSLHLYFYYTNLTAVYDGQKDYKNAYITSRKLADVRVWLNQKRQSRDSRLQMTQLKAALDIEKKETEITLLAARQQQQSLFLLASIAVSVLLLSLLVVLQRARRRSEHQRTELARLNGIKDQLFAIISHDLRGPVVSLRQSLELIERTNVASELARPLARFGQLTQTLLSLTDNLLYWSLGQMTGLKTSRQVVALGPIITETLRLYEAAIQQKNLHLHRCESLLHPDGAVLLADEQHTRIAVRNILQNAIKFSPVGGHIRLAGTEQNGQFSLTVADDGPGFDWQAGQNVASQTSTGLGLTVVADLMHRNGGAIQVERRANPAGAIVRLSWPAQVVPKEEWVTAPSESYS
jgi:signal transduction histidine kinase